MSDTGTSAYDEQTDFQLGSPPVGPTVEFLEERLAFHINHYKKKRNKNRCGATYVQVATLVFGGTTTILLGLKDVLLKDYANLAFATSAFVTAMTTWDAFADYDWKWTRYRSTLYSLYTIRDDLRYELTRQNAQMDELLDGCYNRLKIALKETDEEWVSQRRKAIGAGRPQTAPNQAGKET